MYNKTKHKEKTLLCELLQRRNIDKLSCSLSKIYSKHTTEILYTEKGIRVRDHCHITGKYRDWDRCYYARNW